MPQGLLGLAAANDQLPLTRKFDADEQHRRSEIARVARELARTRGYDGVTVREIASGAGVSPVTIYRYFGSKDGVLLHLMTEWSITILEELYATANQRSGSIADRISEGMQLVIERAAEEMDLLTASMSSITSSRNDGVSIEGFRPVFLELARGSLGDPEWTESSGAVHILGHVYIACLLDLTVGRTSLADVTTNIETAATLLLRDVQH